MRLKNTIFGFIIFCGTLTLYIKYFTPGWLIFIYGSFYVFAVVINLLLGGALLEMAKPDKKVSIFVIVLIIAMNISLPISALLLGDLDDTSSYYFPYPFLTREDDLPADIARILISGELEWLVRRFWIGTALVGTAILSYRKWIFPRLQSKETKPSSKSRGRHR